MPDPGRRVVVEVQIGAADGGALDGDDDALGPGQDRIGDVLDPDGAWSFEDGGSHVRTLPAGLHSHGPNSGIRTSAPLLPETHASDSRTQHHR